MREGRRKQQIPFGNDRQNGKATANTTANTKVFDGVFHQAEIWGKFLKDVRANVWWDKIFLELPMPTHLPEDAIVDLRDLELPAINRLNNDHALETSLLSEQELARLIGVAFYARGFAGSSGAGLLASGPAALLIAFDQTAPYKNPNFQFFLDRHERFVYIDCLITADHARRRGLARRLYEDLFAQAQAAGHRIVGCEVNLDPPNPASDAFHASIGFVEVGRARLENGKTVRYLERRLEQTA
jgi:uncharacterized protein